MRILIIGDSCIDDFIYGDINRIEDEVRPIPVFVPSHNKKIKYNLEGQNKECF